MGRGRHDERSARVGLARRRLREGDSAVLAGRLPEAADLYAVAAYELDGLDLTDPDVAALSPPALAGHGGVDLELGNPRRALGTLTGALDLAEPGTVLHATVFVGHACALRDTGALDEAIAVFGDAPAVQRAVDRCGEAVVRTLDELSRALRLRGDGRAAARAAREAVEPAGRLAPGGLAAAVSHHCLWQALDDLGRADDAEAHLTLLLRHAPDASATADAVDRWCEGVLAREGATDALPRLDRHLAVIRPQAPAHRSWACCCCGAGAGRPGGGPVAARRVTPSAGQLRAGPVRIVAHPGRQST
ncbi:hypothetical protein ACIGNX_26930 [Actinosynnema sp. NPDC053489]|uniref:hypothetical protein n=1 Tax=Actinosynnema sp. NPDC053489 TaxID=3363916 RepID=UPI0037C64664